MIGRKQQLLDALIRYLVKHGLADLSLRPMAAATGTSARLLIFHFGSKERLLLEVLREMQERLQRSFQKLRAEGGGPRRGTLLRAFWAWATSSENCGYLRLSYQLQMLAAQNPRVYGRYLRRNSTTWLELVTSALPPAQQTPGFATLYGAVFDGLFLELTTTGDRRRVSAALDEFVHLAQAHAASAVAGARRPARARVLSRSSR